MPPAKSRKSAKTEWNYEMTVEKIEEIIAQIEAGQMGLADVFEQFGVAVSHLQECETFLAERQAQVDLLVETLKDEPAF